MVLVRNLLTRINFENNDLERNVLLDVRILFQADAGRKPFCVSSIPAPDLFVLVL